MKLRLKLLTILWVAVLGCSGNKFNQFEEKPKPSIEKIIYDGLETWAQNATECKEQKLTLVQKNESLVRSLVKQIQTLAKDETQGTPEINLKALQTYANSSSDKPDRLVYEIITSDNFKIVLTEMAKLMTDLAKNKEFTYNLSAIRDDLNQESGDRIAELLTLNSFQQHALLGAVRTLSCKQANPQDFGYLLMTPQLMWWLAGPNAIYLLLHSDILVHAKPIAQVLKTVKPTKDLENFFIFLHQMAPQQDVCSIENLDAYEKPLNMIEHLLKDPKDTNEQRPLRKFLNLMFKIHSMNNTNQCAGISFDALKSEDIQHALLQAADFLTNEKSGVINFLQKIKP